MREAIWEATSMQHLPVVLFIFMAVVALGCAALLLGFIALIRIRQSGGKLRGRGIAIAAVIGGALTLLTGPPCVSILASFIERAGARLPSPMAAPGPETPGN